MTVGVMLVDDHPHFRCAMRDMLDAMPEFDLVGECESGEASLGQIQFNLPRTIGVGQCHQPLSTSHRTLEQQVANLPCHDLAAFIGNDRELPLFVAEQSQLSFDVLRFLSELKSFTEESVFFDCREASRAALVVEQDSLDGRQSLLIRRLPAQNGRELNIQIGVGQLCQNSAWLDDLTMLHCDA